uniref:Uncharacterized protein n=1 Tax=Malurus cyaneus samueli TaxID=2593467 RepID=A0A8C5T3G8_9PASS
HSNHLMDYQENNLPDGTVPLLQDSASELATEKSHKNCADSKKEDDTKASKEGNITLVGTSLSQKAEVENHKYDMKKSTTAPPSLTDISSAMCSEGPDCHSTMALQDSDISHLIDEVSLSTESELDSTVSALIGQLDGTDDQTPLAPVSSTLGSSGQTPRVGAALPHVFAATPAAECKSHRELICKKILNSLENNLPGSPCSSSLSLVNAHPNRNCSTKCGPSWEAPESVSSFGSNNLIFEEALGDPVTGEHSDSSSLMEVDGGSQELLVTACEYRREDMSQLASPLRLRQKQDPGHAAGRTSGNSTTAGLCSAGPYCSENFRTAGSLLPYPPPCENVGVLCQQHSDRQQDAMCTPQLSSASPLLPAPFSPHPAIQQSSPCKSKSLGDLTSEDISCNFESKYQYISRSFISSGLRDRKLAAMQSVRPHSTDALTEQLRKLLSLEQEDGLECSGQGDEECPRALVRKLSSRSQSRVRNIASRARERQEAAGRPRPCEPVPGVVLRNKGAVSPLAVNRHSTGSYIARYLHGCPGERRGVPEGACSALQHGCGGCGERLCTHGPGLPLPPGAQDQPEIYFLLRL